MNVFFKTTIACDGDNTSLFRNVGQKEALKVAKTLGGTLGEVVRMLLELDDDQCSMLVSLQQYEFKTKKGKILALSVVNNNLMEEDVKIIPMNGIVVDEESNLENVRGEISIVIEQLSGRVAQVSEVIQ